MGIVYGFYELVSGWLKPKAKRKWHAIKRLVPKIPKRKTRYETTSPQDIISEVHELTRHRVQTARAAIIESARAVQVRESLNQAENDIFWRQIAIECQKITGSTNFKSYDRDLGLKKK